MDMLEVMKARHSVRRYTDKKIEGDIHIHLQKAVEACNRESGLNIQLCVNEPSAFTSMLARYGKFSNVRNYIALVGKPGAGFDEKCGYYGEKLVLIAQQLGLNTCWVALTFSKRKTRNIIKINTGEKLLMVIAVGFGENAGVPHKSKPMEALCRVEGAMPDWFRRGMEAALLAPTAMNQQKFRFDLDGNTVKASGTGVYGTVDLGIAKYHFELGAGGGGWQWA